MKIQKTYYNKLQNSINTFIYGIFKGPWSYRSSTLISLLVGFYMGSNLSIYYLKNTAITPFSILIIVIIFELIVRLRSRIKSNNIPLIWNCVDNIRIGSLYSITLEAFKLGS